MADLFKTRTKKDKKNRAKLAQELLDAYQRILPLEKVLFGDLRKEEYATRGSYFFGKHKSDSCILKSGKIQMAMNDSKRGLASACFSII